MPTPSNFSDLRQTLNQIRKTALDQENQSYQEFLSKSENKSENQINRIHDHITQIVTIEAAILGGIAVFASSLQITIFLTVAMVSILLSILLGVFLQKITLDSSVIYGSQQWISRLKQHWDIRERLNDVTVKNEREIVEPHLGGVIPKLRNSWFLEKFHIEAETVRSWFYILFYVSLILLCFHILFSIRPTKNENEQYRGYSNYNGQQKKNKIFFRDF